VTLYLFLAAGWLGNPSMPQVAVMATEVGDPATILVGSGVAGACLVVFAFAAVSGKIRFPPEVGRLEARVEKLEAEIVKERAEKDSLRDQLMRTLPTFAQAANTMVQQAVPVIQQADVQQTRVAETLAHLLDRAEELLGDDTHPHDAG
jgi:hypothetical protein